MDVNYKALLPADFSADSRVWIYQGNRPFSSSELEQIGEWLHTFVSKWQSHGTPVKGYGHVFFDQFIVLMADESATGVSGCSTDGSVRLVKQIEQEFDVQLFDRQLLAFVVNEKIQVVPLSQLKNASENMIYPDTLYFNNTVQTRKELENSWIIPIEDSWLASRVPFKKGIV